MLWQYAIKQSNNYVAVSSTDNVGHVALPGPECN